MRHDVEVVLIGGWIQDGLVDVQLKPSGAVEASIILEVNVGVKAEILESAGGAG